MVTPTESGIVVRRGMLVLLASLLAAPSLTAAASGPPSFSLPEQASEVAPGVFFLGHAVENGVALLGYAYARYATTDERGRRANAKPEGTPGNGNGKGGGGDENEQPSASSCYSYIAKGAHWNDLEPYLFDSEGIPGADLLGTDGAFGTWETAAADDIVGSGTTVSGLSADTSSPDQQNEIYFASIDDTNVLGYTIVWYTRSRGRFVGQIVEADMVIDTGWSWYTDNDELTDDNLIDFWSVFTHEAGHWVGMGHTDTSNLCSGQTMYPSISSGDSSKRVLGEGDVFGVHALYTDHH